MKFQPELEAFSYVIRILPPKPTGSPDFPRLEKLISPTGKKHSANRGKRIRQPGF